MNKLCLYCFKVPPTIYGGRNNDPKEANRGVHKKKPHTKEVHNRT